MCYFLFKSRSIEVSEICVCNLIIMHVCGWTFKLWYRIFSQFIFNFFSWKLKHTMHKIYFEKLSKIRREFFLEGNKVFSYIASSSPRKIWNSGSDNESKHYTKLRRCDIWKMSSIMLNIPKTYERPPSTTSFLY